ncbi:hypothetical protein [Salinibacterium sp. ZJ450]|uniref:hypothetical protein n=1 Tax=Salinibacterium sp. ZJ450 TaxID=2708338 RepID=UPI001420D095|nr:hypothetical protein [Salinibacterium sp. ZJ450]
MQIPISLPLDSDGFLRRECPNCELEFKWHHGKTPDAPEDFVYPPVYWCPRCGRSAGHDSWWTPEQLDYARAAAMGPMLDQLDDELAGATRGSKHLSIKLSSERPEIPDPMVEPDDMIALQPPCHPWEPVKVPENSAQPHFCLVCGEAFAA